MLEAGLMGCIVMLGNKPILYVEKFGNKSTHRGIHLISLCTDICVDLLAVMMRWLSLY